MPFLYKLQLLDDKPYEHLIRVQETVVDPQLDQLTQKVKDLLLEVKATRYCVLLQGFDDQRLKQSNVRSNGGLLREHIKIALETMMKWSVL